MKIQQTPWLIFLLIFLLTKSNAESKICRRSENCQCFNNSDHYEFQCSEIGGDEEEVILHVYPNALIKIDCNNVANLSLLKLPEVKFENIEKLQIRYCPVPENGVREIVDHFGMTNLDVLGFEFGVFEEFVLPTEKFKGLSNVTTLRLRGNDLKSIEDQFFVNFPKLKSLELDRNNLYLEGHTFSSLTNLKFFSLSDNKLNNLADDLFQGLENLEKLNLWKNNIKSLNSRSFNGLSILKSLELSFNRIEVIEDTSLNALSNLVNVSMRNNVLKKLSKKNFESNLLLEQFEASGNPSLTLVDDVFSNFTYLKRVDLSNCKLEYISEGLFRNSTALESLSLERNNIEELPKNIFDNLSNLRTLKLSSNKIRLLDDEIFTSLINLEILDLKHNRLEEINENLLKHNFKLKEINLSYNAIKKIHLEAFIRNKNLVKLSLSHNRYSYQDPGVYPVSPFNKCGDLQEIDLSHNEILDFPEDLMLLASMRTMNLSWNNISSIRVNALWKVTVNELKIDLDHNRILRLNFDNVESTALQQTNLDAYHNAGASTVIKISENPFICDCFAIDFVRYIRNEMYPGVKSAIFFVYDDVRCNSPEIFKGIPINDVTPPMLSCPIEDVIDNFTCSNTEKCACAWRPFDYSLVVDCGNRNLTKLPEIYQPTQLIFNQTEVRLQNNFLKNISAADAVGYDNVSKLFLGGNIISDVNWIPPRLEILDLRSNNIKRIHQEILDYLNSTRLQHIDLDGNPWRCDCAASKLTNYLRQHVHQIDTRRHIFCEGTSKLLINLTEKDLCPHSPILLASATVLVLLLCIFTSLAAFYYKYQQEIKIWMYAHNICLFLIEEEELDKDKVYDAFVSYSHKDEEFVIENLISILEGGPQPYKLCVHFRNWIPGEFIATQVTSSVKDSRRTLVVLSPNFLESVWGKMEFRTAHTEAMKEGRARVIIVLYGDINMDSLDDELKAYMKTNTYIKWGDPWFWDKLKYALPHSKIKGSNKKSQKHANMMKYIDDKFSLIEGKVPSRSDSTTSICKDTEDKCDVKLNMVEGNTIKHEIG